MCALEQSEKMMDDKRLDKKDVYKHTFNGIVFDKKKLILSYK